MNPPGYATIDEVIELGVLLLAMAKTYHVKKKGEFFYDALFFPLLKARCQSASRQEKLKLRPGQKRRQRLDFRLGGGSFSPALELAHGSRRGGLGPSSNESELQKLCRQKNAQMRYLLLLDTSKYDPYTKDELRAQYSGWNLGPGRFARRPVRVIYARVGHSFHFKWKASK